MRRKLKNRNIRKVFRSGGSYAITLPLEMVKALGIKEKQRLIVNRAGKKIIIEDWGQKALPLF